MDHSPSVGTYQISLIIKQLHAYPGNPLRHILSLDVSHTASESPKTLFHPSDSLWHFKQDFHGFTDRQCDIRGEVNASRRDINGLGLMIALE
jgi:hypothetical protein